MKKYCTGCEKEKDISEFSKHSHRKEAVRQYILEIKIKSKCKICGEERIACLDFHHKNKLEKLIAPARLSSTGWSMKRIKKEINKCIILCSNCHRVLHWEENCGSIV